MQSTWVIPPQIWIEQPWGRGAVVCKWLSSQQSEKESKQKERWVARNSAKDGASWPLAVPWPQEALQSKNDKTALGPFHNKGTELLPSVSEICCGQLPLLGVTFQARFTFFGENSLKKCHLPTLPPIANRKWMTRLGMGNLTVKHLAQILQYEEAMWVGQSSGHLHHRCICMWFEQLAKAVLQAPSCRGSCSLD